MSPGDVVLVRFPQADLKVEQHSFIYASIS